MANDQFEGGHFKGESQKMEQYQGIQTAGHTDQDSVARREEITPTDMVLEVVRKTSARPSHRAQFSGRRGRVSEALGVRRVHPMEAEQNEVQ